MSSSRAGHAAEATHMCPWGPHLPDPLSLPRLPHKRNSHTPSPTDCLPLVNIVQFLWGPVGEGGQLLLGWWGSPSPPLAGGKGRHFWDCPSPLIQQRHPSHRQVNTHNFTDCPRSPYCQVSGSPSCGSSLLNFIPPQETLNPWMEKAPVLALGFNVLPG